MTPKQLAQLFSYYLLPFSLVITALFVTNLEFFYFLGEFALYLLFFTLLLKPLSVLSKAKVWKTLLGYRREIGILIFWMVMIHGVVLWLRAGYSNNDFFTLPYLFFGLIAGLGIVVLGLTSNRISTRLLKKHWKTVHIIAYPTLIFAVLHATKASGEYVIFSLLALIYFSLRLWAFASQRSTLGSRGHKNEPSSSNPSDQNE